MAEKDKAQSVAWVTFSDGEDIEIKAASVIDYARKNHAGIVSDGVLEISEIGAGLCRLDVHTDAITEGMGFHFEEDTAIPIMHDRLPNNGGIRTDIPYFVVFDEEKKDLDAELWTCHTDALIPYEETEWTWGHVHLHRTDQETGETIPATSETVCATEETEDGTVIEHVLGEAGLYPEKLVNFCDDSGRPLTFGDLITGIWILSASLAVAEQARAERNKPVTIRSGADFSQLMRGATKRIKTRGVVLKNRNGDKEVTRITAIEDFLELKPSGRKTMLKINQEATRLSQNGEYRHDGETVCRVGLGVAETARQYGITEASARKRLRRDFKAIANESITVKQGKSWVTIPVAGGAFGIRGDSAFFTLSPDFMQVMLGPKRPQLDLPPEIYGTDDTNHPAALQIGFKLYNHDNMNYGRPNQDRMSLEALLYAATELPKAGTVNRHETEKIMGPFEAAMNHLVDKGVLKDWDYCHENGEPLTDEEQQAIQTEHDLGKPTPWAMAQGLLVTWELGKRYEKNEEARQASRERRKAAALEAKAEMEKEAKAKEKRIRGKVETMEAKKRFEEAEKANAEK